MLVLGKENNSAQTFLIFHISVCQGYLKNSATVARDRMSVTRSRVHPTEQQAVSARLLSSKITFATDFRFRASCNLLWETDLSLSWEYGKQEATTDVRRGRSPSAAELRTLSYRDIGFQKSLHQMLRTYFTTGVHRAAINITIYCIWKVRIN